MKIVEVSEIPKAGPIPEDDPVKIRNVCAELQKLCDRENGIGISAVQAGVPWRLFLVKGDGTCPLVPKHEYHFFVDTEYEPVGDEKVYSIEGCLSLRDKEGALRMFQVLRHANVKVTGRKMILPKTGELIQFEPFTHVLDFNQQGIVFQHEVDHHNDKLISELGDEVMVW